MKDNFNDLQIADQKLNCSFIKLMPDYLKEEVIEVLNKYKSYCNEDAKIVDDESKVYKKFENGTIMVFDVLTFMNVWDSYSYSIWHFRRSLWTSPSEFFKNAEREFLYPDDILNFENEDKRNKKRNEREMKDNLEIAGHKLNCDFIKLMPDFLEKELIDVLNEYKSYCNKDAKVFDDKHGLYEKNENGVVMIFSVTGFIEAWNSYRFSIKECDPYYSICNCTRSLWIKPSEFFKKLESNFLSKRDTLIFESVSPTSLKKELQNKIDQYCSNDIMAYKKK